MYTVFSTHTLPINMHDDEVVRTESVSDPGKPMRCSLKRFPLTNRPKEAGSSKGAVGSPFKQSLSTSSRTSYNAGLIFLYEILPPMICVAERVWQVRREKQRM